jgi:hypothetical protein
MRCDLLNERTFGHFKNGDHLFTRYRRKTFKKIFKRVTCFQIIEQILDRYACSGKYGDPAHFRRVNLDDIVAHNDSLSWY